jgi:transposase InsO family protein
VADYPGRPQDGNVSETCRLHGIAPNLFHLERAKEKHPEAKPRIISDNGPQFVARDFKEFIRISGMTHVRTSPYYPQSNGKL